MTEEELDEVFNKLITTEDVKELSNRYKDAELVEDIINRVYKVSKEVLGRLKVAPGYTYNGAAVYYHE